MPKGEDSYKAAKLKKTFASNRPRGYKTMFMLISAEQDILNAHKYEQEGHDGPRSLT